MIFHGDESHGIRIQVRGLKLVQFGRFLSKARSGEFSRKCYSNLDFLQKKCLETKNFSQNGGSVSWLTMVPSVKKMP